MYAIVATGGKQYRVQPGQVLEVELLDVADGARIDLGNVLMIGNGDDVTIGRPTVEGARCVVDVLGTAKGKKGEVAPPPIAPLDVAALQGTVPAGTSIIPVGEGDVREITLADGTKKKIRILRAPGTAAITSSTPE